MSDYNRPSIRCRIAFAVTDPRTALTDAGLLTDVSAYLRTDDLSIRRGRADELQGGQAGTLTCILRNPDRRFEPEYASGAYSPNVVPMRRIVLDATWNSATYNLFRGLITSWTPDYDAATGDAIVIVQAVDLLGSYLAQAVNQVSVAGMNTGQAIVAVIFQGGAGLSAFDHDADFGNSVLSSSYTGVGEKMAAVIQAAARVEGTPVWCDGQGRVIFQSRQARYNVSAPAVGIGGATEPQASRIRLLATADQYLYASVTVTRSGGTPQTATSATTLASYGPRELVLSLETASDNESYALADYLLSLYDEPRLRIQEIELHGETAPATLWPIILDAEVQDRVTVTHQPPGGGAPIVREVRIESIALSVRGNAWSAVWTLSPSDTDDLNAWILENATYGLLGQTTRLAY